MIAISLLTIVLSADAVPAHIAEVCERIDAAMAVELESLAYDLREAQNGTPMDKDAAKKKSRKVKELTLQMKALRDSKKVPWLRIPTALKKGDAGRLQNARIIQVVDKQNAIVEISYTSPRHTYIDTTTGRMKYDGERNILWLQGVDTSNFSTNADAELDGLFFVSGTKKYEAGVGQKIISLVEPLDPAEVEKHWPQWRKENPLPRPKRR